MDTSIRADGCSSENSWQQLQSILLLVSRRFWPPWQERHDFVPGASSAKVQETSSVRLSSSTVLPATSAVSLAQRCFIRGLPADPSAETDPTSRMIVALLTEIVTLRARVESLETKPDSPETKPEG